VSGGVDTTVVAAFAVGFISFISPCVLPLVPGYLSAVSGVSLAEMRSGERSTAKILLPAIVFCLSFTAVFVALGMTATGLGSTLQSQRNTLDKVAGAVIIALGIFFLLTPFVPRLNREWRPDALISRAGSGGPLVAGAAFVVNEISHDGKLYLEAGGLSAKDLIADIKQGFYVTELMGMGVNGVTGDYSRGAAGFWIEKGKIAFPVSEVTIAGNLKEMFLHLTPANDLVFRYGTNAPTIRIEGMTIAGA